MSDSEMIEYEINDDAYDHNDMNLNKNQSENKSQNELNFTKNIECELRKNHLSFFKENKTFTQVRDLQFDNNYQSSAGDTTAKIRINNELENKKLSDGKKNEKKISNKNFDLKLNNHYKNFNTISNIDKDNLPKSRKSNLNSNNNFGNKNSFDNKMKNTTNNKYSTINSNNNNNIKKTGTPLINNSNKENSRFNKFENQLLDHFKSMKQLGKSSTNNTINQTSKKINNQLGNNFSSINQTQENLKIKTTKSSSILNKIREIKPMVISKNPKNLSINPNVNLDLNLEDYKTAKNSQLKFLMSDQFKQTLDNSVKHNKSFQSASKANKYSIKKSLISFDLSNKRENVTNVSLGERLYRKSVAMREIKEKNATIELNKRECETIKYCSFRPKICEDSVMMNVKSRYSTISNPQKSREEISGDFSSFFIKKNSKIIESFKLKKELEDLREMRPSIKKPEKEIMKIVEKLHNEKDTIRVEREKLADMYFTEIYPFKPTISDKTEPNIDNFFDRLQNWVEKRNEKIETNIVESFYDKKTGKKLFQPTISQTLENVSHRQDKDLFEYLYNDKHTRTERLSGLELNNKKEIVDLSKIKLSIDKTDQINKLLKDDCFANLFEILDHNNDGVIECSDSFMKCAEEKLEKNVLDIFYPILMELKEHEESLSREEFHLAFEELFKVLNVAQRRDILNWYVNSKRVNTNAKRNSLKENLELRFQPIISENSHNYFARSSRYSKNFLDRNIDFKISKENFYKEKSEEKKINELTGCTFKPEVNKVSEIIDKRNKSVFLQNLNDFDLLLKPLKSAKNRSDSKL